MKLSSLSVEQHQKVIDARVHPAIEGLTIGTVDLGEGRGLLVIGVPAQPSEYKPFLVHGAIVGDRVEGAFISIVRRRGEGSIATTASQIHAMLTTGRALLQEMTADRLRQERERLREKSEAAASQVLEEVRQADDESNRPPVGPSSYFLPHRCLALAEAIRRYDWGIDDDQVKDRISRCHFALAAFGTNHATFQGDKSAATYLLKRLVHTIRVMLEAYIVGKPLPPWDDDLPQKDVEAYDWLSRASLGHPFH